MIRIKIKQEWQQAASNFAIQSLSTRKSKIAQRGQSSEKKILQDITSGTIAEYGVQAYLRLLGIEVSAPDITIYKVRDKKWSADLAGSGLQVHVKTFTNPRWSSWVFTYNPDRGDVDPVVEAPTENDVLALTQVTADHVLIHYIVAAGSVINLYRPPLLPQLQYSKLVLYPADLDRVTNLIDLVPVFS